MKWIGFFLVLIGSGGIGFSLVLEYTGRLRELTTVRQMIHYIADAILYDGLPLAEAFFRCSMRMEGEYGAFLERLFAERIRRGFGKVMLPCCLIG